MSSVDKAIYGLMKFSWSLPHLVYQHCRAHKLQFRKLLARSSLLLRIQTNCCWYIFETGMSGGYMGYIFNKLA